ncbi:hypothetical protein M440DRAFT_1435519 [Trichoderma longibrachiatum ATCC 18648]|uniref:SH3 domain-containing protein n=1 Tax=Trichoderma longibrachiatum ATCC 18648 TaxID=983965 RepID=A0A2T4CJT1_TRILO|nr:hypothetical protein M440DRAFT_1435519 [Trichoderma longibrachiatum ATCC 18648]
MDVYQQHQHQQDSLAAAHNGNAADDDDIEDDGDLDDDMMDRISSSPSIEDALTPRLPLQLPARQTQTFCTRFALPIIIFLRVSMPDETHEAERDRDGDGSCGCGCDNGQDLCAHQAEADTNIDADADADLSLTIPYNKSFEDDDDSDFSLPDDPRFIDYGWAAECLHEPEDIDFEFVYALHTFVATVEGQANATKGDTMVLLDDSNSYWWLVRVVKDSSIGYLPAEHIETPTERLARLNKHRNIDLSASMLTDQQPPKQKSGFSIGIKKKATVVFAEPTYFDYSDHDYSSEEEDADETSEPATARQKKLATSGDDEDATDESARVEPLKPNKSKAAKLSEQIQDDLSDDDEDLRGSLEIVEKRDGPSISRNGNIRNTDSFFKDETTETKKITLTPNLLRDDGPRESTDSMSSKPRTSLDKFEKELMSDKDRKKSKEKDRSPKDKKPGGLRGFFSRKDKKHSPDDRPEGESRDSEERHSEEHSSPEKPRQPAKLHKQQARVEPTVNNKAPQASTVELASYLAESRINDVSNVPPPSMRIVNPETNETQEVPSHQPPRGRPSLETTPPTTRRGPEVAISPRSATAPRALSHLDLSDSDESEDGDAILNQMPQPNSSAPLKTAKAPQDDEDEAPIIPGSFPDSNPSATADKSPVSQPPLAQTGARSHSASPVLPVASSEPPALMVDTSSPDDRSPSASPSPELTQSAEDRSKSSSSSTGSKEQTWDDMKLHAFFNEPDHVRDLLVVVYDKTDVVPASSDHPVVGGLFREQNAKLAEITTQLDNMLGDWLARKQRTRGSR